MQKNIDIQENSIYEIDEKLLEILLKDRSSKKNIIWATDNYAMRGKGYQEYDHIAVKSITGRNGLVIKPRIKKSKREQQIRIKKKAEVFTPSWICNKQNNELDKIWFEKENVFNTESGDSWKTNYKKIIFSDLPEKTWKDYVKQKALEITCGEAPYLASRYDTVSGEWIDIQDRIGALDRKLRVVGENTQTEDEWHEWVVKAYKSTFGYEWQGDSLLIARENLLFTFIDYYFDRFKKQPSNEQLIEIAKILSWNLWQMDGLKHVVPNSCKPIPKFQLSFFEDMEQPDECTGCEKGNSYKHTGIYCKIKNWKTNRTILFNNIKGRKGMKFDFIIGNPPYQEESLGDKKADGSIYNYFMEASYEIGNKVLLITPAKFLFNNGNTPSKWNKKMLKDRHFKVLFFEPIASKIFSNVSFMGGVAIHYRDKNAEFDPILQFIEFPELRSIFNKVSRKTNKSLTSIIYNQNKFDLDKLYADYDEIKSQISSGGKEKRMTSGCLKYECFYVDRKSRNDVQILGVINNKRVKRYLDRKYLEEPNENIDKYKVIIPANNGSGAIGEVSSTPLIGEPLIGEPFVGYTQTFIGVGAFETLQESSNALSYIKSKFCRAMLGILKVTQNGKRDMWKHVPLQDFTNQSDINWLKSISEIDNQLYKKYCLSQEEINFIESNVEAMN
ncbi:MAG: Eco57I restriction-modification methylase domain-containing protein [Clostridia bacterium]|nr:Eco57I restriction-modification methylase domain-containing protein [Clostridia bacterium]